MCSCAHALRERFMFQVRILSILNIDVRFHQILLCVSVSPR